MRTRLALVALVLVGAAYQFPGSMTLAAAEQLDAHREAVRIRLETTGDQP